MTDKRGAGWAAIGSVANELLQKIYPSMEVAMRDTKIQVSVKTDETGEKFERIPDFYSLTCISMHEVPAELIESPEGFVPVFGEPAFYRKGDELAIGVRVTFQRVSKRSFKSSISERKD